MKLDDFVRDRLSVFMILCTTAIDLHSVRLLTMRREVRHLVRDDHDCSHKRDISGRWISRISIRWQRAVLQ